MRNLPLTILFFLLMLLGIFAFDNSQKQLTHAHSNHLTKTTLQDSVLELAGTLRDTIILQTYLKEARSLRDSGALEEALASGEKALEIALDVLGTDHMTVSSIYNTLGLIHKNKRAFDLALANFEKSLKIRTQLLTNNHTAVADVMGNIGLVWHDLRKYDKAILSYEEALGIRRTLLGERHPKVADLKQRLGAAWHRKGDYKKALVFFEESLAIRLEALGPKDPKVAESQRNIGVIYEETGKYKQALDFYDRALKVQLEHYGEDHPELISVYNNIGVAQMNKGEHDLAIQYYDKVIHISNLAYGPGHKRAANAYNNAGISWEKKGDLDKSLEYHKNALRIRTETFGLGHPALLSSYGNIGVVLIKKGEDDQALRYMDKVVSLIIKNKGPNHPQLVVSYSNLSSIWRKKKAYKKAIQYAEQAQAIVINTFGNKHPYLLSTNLKLGSIYLELNDYEKALSYTEEGLRLGRDIYGENNFKTARAYNNYGNTLKRKGDYEEAMVYFEKALAIKKNLLNSKHPSIANTIANIGNLWKEKGDYEKSLNYLTQSLEVVEYRFSDGDSFSDCTDVLFLRDVFINLAKLYTAGIEHPGFRDSLNTHYPRLIALEDFIQKELINQQTSQFHAAQSVPVYEAAMTHFWEEGEATDPAFLFLCSERTKSRMLSEKLTAASNTTTFGLPDSLRNLEQTLQLDLTNYEKKKFKETFESASPKDSLLRLYDNKLFELNQRKDALLETFKGSYPAYYKLRYSQEVIRIEEVQDSLLQSETGASKALVEYFVGDSSIYTFVILPDTFYIQQIKKDFPLEKWVQEMRCGIFADFIPPATSCPAESYAQRAHQLYQRLFAAVDAVLPDSAAVTIVPDGVLGYLPFDALLVEPLPPALRAHQAHYLLRDHPISYAYSASLQREMQSRQHRQPPTKKVLAFAPSFGNDQQATGDTTLLASRSIDTRNRRNWLSPLTYNDDEIRAIDSLIGADMYLDSMATEARFRELAGDYRILHLSTHGKANDELGDYSFLAFHQLDDSLENEWLYNRELYNLELNADLVVLSACETGIGELQRGEGIISLARGFSYAGAKSIVTSLWSVNDQSTKVLMELFYQHLKAGMSKDRALRQAKLDYLANYPNLGAAPYFWAGFIPIGDMSPVDLSNNAVVWWVLGGLLLFGLGLWLYLRKEW